MSRERERARGDREPWRESMTKTLSCCSSATVVRCLCLRCVLQSVLFPATPRCLPVTVPLSSAFFLRARTRGSTPTLLTPACCFGPANLSIDRCGQDVLDAPIRAGNFLGNFHHNGPWWWRVHEGSRIGGGLRVFLPWPVVSICPAPVTRLI